MIRVVIADDSAFMRKVLSDLFTKTPDFQVVGKATNGKEAVELVAKYKPDLLTLDVNMPIMDGLEALKVIMKDCPVPVLMFSSLTKQGAEETIRALELGAVDFLCKTGGSISRIDAIEEDILQKCRSVAAARIGNINFRGNILPKKQEGQNLKRINIFEKRGYSTPFSRKGYLNESPVGGERESSAINTSTTMDRANTKIKQPVSSRLDIMAKRENPLLKRSSAPAMGRSSEKIVVLGTSTGGPKALQYVIPKLPADLPCGVLVVQHMPAGFTKSLAERLNGLSKVKVKEAEDGEPILPGHVYIAPGNYHMTVSGSRENKMIALNQNPPLASHRPAVDIMFDSVVQYGANVVSVIMTGMGCDGAAGMKKIKAAGGHIIAESDETTIVYGMPKSVIEAGLADQILPVGEIAEAIVMRVSK